MAQVDQSDLVLGPPRFGKSTLARTLVANRLREGWIVLAHDKAHQYKACAPYASTDAFLRAWDEAARKGTPFPRGASFRCEADDVTRLAMRMGKHYGNRHDRVRQPIYLAFDESVKTPITSHSIPDMYLEVIAERAHFGFGLCWLLQWPSQLHTAILETSTDRWCFQQSSSRLRDLAEKFNREERDLRPLPRLPKYHGLHFKVGEDAIEHFVTRPPAGSRGATVWTARPDAGRPVSSPDVPAQSADGGSEAGASAAAPAPVR